MIIGALSHGFEDVYSPNLLICRYFGLLALMSPRSLSKHNDRRICLTFSWSISLGLLSSCRSVSSWAWHSCRGVLQQSSRYLQYFPILTCSLLSLRTCFSVYYPTFALLYFGWPWTLSGMPPSTSSRGWPMRSSPSSSASTPSSSITASTRCSTSKPTTLSCIPPRAYTMRFLPVSRSVSPNSSSSSAHSWSNLPVKAHCFHKAHVPRVSAPVWMLLLKVCVWLWRMSRILWRQRMRTGMSGSFGL